MLLEVRGRVLLTLVISVSDDYSKTPINIEVLRNQCTH